MTKNDDKVPSGDCKGLLNWFRRFYPLKYFGATAVVTAALAIGVVRDGCLSITICYLTSGVLSYALLIHWIAEHMRRAEKYNFVGIVALFVFVSALLSIFLSVAWHNQFRFGSLAAGGLQIDSKSIVNSIYFSTTVFTTLGFGDLAPFGFPSKMFASFCAMFGITHMVAFVALALNRLSTAGDR